MSSSTDGLRYPRLPRRIQAAAIDSIILSTAILVTFVIVSPFEIHGGLKAFAVALALFVLEPGLVCITGATIGHRLKGLRVQDTKTSRKLDIFRATFRFLVKVLLGLPSLILILTTKKHQAIHDLASRSTVIIANPTKIGEHDALPERVIEEAEYIYPSKLRRTSVIALYNLLGLIAIGLLFGMTMSDGCFYYESCTSKDRVYEAVFSFAWLAGLALSIVLGWQGRLWGCMRKKRGG